jgi:methylthioribose-1-phosphate isomerase
MKIDGRRYRTIWLADDGWSVQIIDQTRLPYQFETVTLCSVHDAAAAIRDMRVRGAPLIGATAAYGVCLALRSDPSLPTLEGAATELQATRPTAVNLEWALAEMHKAVADLAEGERVAAAYRRAAALCDEDVATCSRIGDHGLELLRGLATHCRSRPLNILTHCNAGWLATVDWGTALAPVYKAHDAGLEVHVWVDETRPRNQGGALTAFELGSHGVPHTVVVDNVGGHLMQRGLVDVCIVGTDRTTAAGDVANKIGTYLKALAARDNGVPFWVAAPSSSIDWTIRDGLGEIPIETRDPREVTTVTGQMDDGRVVTVTVTAPGSVAANFAFDVTPAGLVTGLITERGLCEASVAGLQKLFPERYVAA